jgi:hypothetical protein
VAIQPRNAPVSPPRKWWVTCKARPAKRTDLIIVELERIMNLRERGEREAIRGFIVAWRKATGDGNPAGIELRIKLAKKLPNTVIVFAEIPGIAVVQWMPAITIPMSSYIDQLMRECGDSPLFPQDRERITDAWGVPERKGRPQATDKIPIKLHRFK